MNIIQDIAEKLVKNICRRACSEEIHDLGALAAGIREDCEKAARDALEEIIREINIEIRRDRAGRRELGLSMKEHDRTRTILTELGEIHIARDCYLDNRSGKHCFLMDGILGIPKRERVDKTVSMKLAEAATQVSYAKSADIIIGGQVSRQTVKNSIMKVQVPEQAVPAEKRSAAVLHVFADEDHAHMQKPEKERGKRSQIVPVVTVTEGIRPVGRRRRRTIHPVSFVDEDFDTKRLWKTVEGYVEKTYNMRSLKKIVIHGDGGQWIRTGLEDFDGVERVMDEFHFQKYLKALSSVFPKRNVKTVITDAVKKNDRKKADRFLQELMADADKKSAEKAKQFGTYLMNNWEPIVNRFTEGMPGSCTEGLVSHLLSERFSRDPLGWSEAGLGRLSHLRIFVLNGGKLTAKDLRDPDSEEEKENGGQSFSEYADQVIEDIGRRTNDWSIFDGEPYVMDGASGTQTLIRNYGSMNSLLN